MSDQKLKDILLLALLLGFVVFMTERCTYDKLPEPTPTCDTLNVTYLGDIDLIVGSNCAIKECHDGNQLVPGDFTTYQGLKQKVDSSFTLSVKDMVDNKIMPLEGSLTDDEIFKIHCWIEAGALNN